MQMIQRANLTLLGIYQSCAPDVKTLTLKKHISAKNDHFQQFQTQVMVFNFVKGEKNIALKKGRANKGVWEVITNPKQYCEIAH